jgi:hypothetical protein
MTSGAKNRCDRLALTKEATEKRFCRCATRHFSSSNGILCVCDWSGGEFHKKANPSTRFQVLA